MATFSNDYLVSKNSRDRFLRWQDDLQRAEARSKEPGSAPKGEPPVDCAPCQYETLPGKFDVTFPRDHTAALLSGTWNEGQPNSPYLPPPGLEDAQQAELTNLGISQKAWNHTKNPSWKTVHHAASSTRKNYPFPRAGRHANGDAQDEPKHQTNDSTTSNSAVSKADLAWQQPKKRRRPPNQHVDGLEDGQDSSAKRSCEPSLQSQDNITDTIGAIAIDEEGCIAAGSSSGGIGMKHRGRLGPAALVGVGTAVVPCQPDDEDGVCVAAVTSGTGEHMATTMASQRCAERLYNSTRKGPKGTDIQDYDESAIMESFIVHDFMGHPGVRDGPSAGAIGIMAVKKTRGGYYLHFAHNTDSFALASMGGRDATPTCVMSRLPEEGKIAQGSRKIAIK